MRCFVSMFAHIYDMGYGSFAVQFVVNVCPSTQILSVQESNPFHSFCHRDVEGFLYVIYQEIGILHPH